VSYDIVVETVAPVALAAVHRRVRPRDVSTVWRQALDQVWTFLRANDGVWAGGHNVFVYHHPVPPDDEMVVEYGVEVGRPFDAAGEVELTHTPAGEVASTLHVGPIADLGAAQAAIESWRAAHGRTFAGISWETYGDWGDDPSKHEVRISYLLREPT
jgi:effector-binding domain-containing protein